MGILSTFGPAPGSVEGMVYTRMPIAAQLAGFREGVVRSLLMAVTLWFWARHPEKRRFGRTLSILFAIAMLLSILGLAARRATPS